MCDMHYGNPTKNGKLVNTWAWFHMCNCVCDFQMWQNILLHVWCSNCREYSSWIHIFMTRIVKFWIQLSDLRVRAVFTKKNRSEGERGVRNILILQYRIYGISVLGVAWHVFGLLIRDAHEIFGYFSSHKGTCPSGQVIGYQH